MRVLITGGYGFIGSFVAERFYQEGYDVSIIDNLSTGDKKNVEFKHKGYVLSVEDSKCEEVFKSGRFEVVVHLAAQVSVAESLDNPKLDAQSNVLGLANMLALSHKYGVHKFIFASSAAVYGMNDACPINEDAPCSPISPYGLNKWIGENYCAKWSEMYGLETLCFRFSNVYGPKQGRTGEGGVISIFLSGALAGRELTVFGSGEQTRDFIYVQDVADAIYRSSYSSMTGVYNLSTNTETSVNALVDTLKVLDPNVQVDYQEGRNGDIDRSSLDNRRVMATLDWAPIINLETGLRRTYDWFRANASERRQSEEKSRNKREYTGLIRWLGKLLPYAENLLVFAGTAWLTISVQDSLYDMFDFKLIYIILLGILYGNRQSLVAIALSTGLYIYQELDKGREMIAMLYDTNFFFTIATYLFVGLVVGYSIERKSALLQAKQRELTVLDDKYRFLNEVYNDTRAIKDELQLQIMNNSDSFGKIYAITKELESLEPEKIFTSTVSVVESIMKTNTVSIYTVNKYRSYLRLVARSQNAEFNLPKSMKAEDYGYIMELMNEKSFYINKQLKEDAPLLAAPIVSNGEVMAVISLHGMPFENFTLYYQNLFKIVVDLISSSLSRALSYVEATGNQRYIEGTTVLRSEVFAEILESKQVASEKHGIEYVVLALEEQAAASEEIAKQIAKSLRETDYIGQGVDGTLMVLLSNSSKQDAMYVLERFTNNHIPMKIVDADRYV